MHSSRPLIKLCDESSHASKTGRIVLITVSLNGLKISFCNIYAPNNQLEQLEFTQELNNCLIDKAEADKDKKGGVPWKPSQFRNMLLITMETCDLLDIQRTRHPNLNIYTYVSKTLNVKSRLDYFLITGSFSQHVKKVGSCPSIAPDHKTIYLDLALPQNTKRGQGFWKFNNLLLNDEEYLFAIHQLIPRLHEKYFQLEDKSLVWELIKMEIRQNTISYAKRKARNMSLHEDELHKRMEKSDQIICNSNDLQNVEDTLKEYDSLKAEVNTIYEQKGKAAMFPSKCRWIEEGERPTKYFFQLGKTRF